MSWLYSSASLYGSTDNPRRSLPGPVFGIGLYRTPRADSAGGYPHRSLVLVVISARTIRPRPAPEAFCPSSKARVDRLFAEMGVLGSGLTRGRRGVAPHTGEGDR